MPENSPVELTPAQVSILQNLLNAGFEFVQLPHVVRYFPVQKNGFVALLDPSAGNFALLGQPGLRIGEGVGMLIEKKAGKVFVWKTMSVDATPAMLEAFERFKDELRSLLAGALQ